MNIYDTVTNLIPLPIVEGVGRKTTRNIQSSPRKVSYKGGKLQDQIRFVTVYSSTSFVVEPQLCLFVEPNNVLVLSLQNERGQYFLANVLKRKPFDPYKETGRPK